MREKNIQRALAKQRAYFRSGRTLPVKGRLRALQKLRAYIKKYENKLYAALEEDLGKSSSESYMCEIGMTLAEITFMEKHLRRLARPRTVATPLAQFASHSFVKPSPYGNVLIISPWNYPFLLTVEPLVDAIAAGNTAIVKPSAYSPATTAAMKQLLEECFEPELVTVVTGGREENQALLEQKFDLIFFTGSQAVGKTVLEKAAAHLTPSILELGGKSPCIVDRTAKIPLAAKRIVWGKYLNCGQTCVAPDYILCDARIKDRLIAEIKKQIEIQFGIAPLGNADYGKIINRKHFDRLCALLDGERQKIVFGGDTDGKRLMISPTVIDHVTWDDLVMQQEIFGPLLPVLTYSSPAEIPALLADQPKPLAFYVFSEDKSRIRRLISSCSFGGGCVNDTVIHLATSNMGFGGVGESGMGAYHGKTGFEAFSHQKSIVDKKTWIDMPMRYQPVTKIHDKMIRMFLH